MGKILVLDDELSSREYLVAVLATAGYGVVQVGSAHAALLVLRAEPIDLVITDMVMPGVNGYEFARTVRRIPLWLVCL
ncbi:MAG: putative OmpR family two-component response regulator [Bryobacterales bacterium]|nr:putative OmpR family two-component response regulator [Bryobacterales bacterium]